MWRQSLFWILTSVFWILSSVFRPNPRCSPLVGLRRAFICCSQPYASLISVGSVQAVEKNDRPMGKAAIEAGGDGDVRVAGDGRGRGAAAGVGIAVDVIDEAGGAGGEGDDGVQLVLGQQRVDAILAREAHAIGAGFEIRGSQSVVPWLAA